MVTTCCKAFASDAPPCAKYISPLPALPSELCLVISRKLSPLNLIVLSSVCRAFRALSEDDDVWQSLLIRQLQPMVDAFFDGTLPPSSHKTVKRHFFELRRSWKQLAQEQTGRMLVQIGTQELSGRVPHELKSIWSLWTDWDSPEPTTYGIYDVTDFTDDHPGIDLHDAASIVDATEWFEMNAHSDAAIRRLDTLAVPGLTGLPYERELERLCQRPLFRSLDIYVPTWACILFTAIVSNVFFNSVCIDKTCEEKDPDPLGKIPSFGFALMVLYFAITLWEGVRMLNTPVLEAK